MSSRSPYVNVQMQNFWKESVDKEASTRLQWFSKQKSGKEMTRGKQFEVFRKKIEGNKPSDALLQRLPPISAEPHFNRKKADFNEPLGLEKAKTDMSLDATGMRPVSPLVRNALYDGFTKEGKGRYNYLHQRNEKNPEEKYTFPCLSSWDIGWRLGDVIKPEDIRKPAHGRNRIVADTFYCRNGIQSSSSRVF